MNSHELPPSGALLSDGDANARLDPGDSVREFGWPEFLDMWQDEISNVAEAWVVLDTIKQTALTERVTEAIEANNAVHDQPDAPKNRADRRKETTGAVRDMRASFETNITVAQFITGQLIFGSEAAKESGQQKLDEITELSTSLEFPEQLAPSDLIIAQVFLDVVGSCKPAMLAERELVWKVDAWLCAGVNNIRELADWLDSPDATNAQYRPLLQALANQHTLKEITSIMTGHFERIQDGFDLYREMHLWNLLQQAEQAPTDDPDLSWLKFLEKTTEGIEIIKQIFSAPLDELPSGIAEKLTDAHRVYVDNLRQRIKQALAPHVQPDHQIIFSINPEMGASAPKNGNRNGKTKPVRKTDKPVYKKPEEQPPKPITVVMRGAAQVGKTYTAERLQEDGKTAIDALMESDMVTKYLANYQSVPGLALSVQRMFESILTEPSGNGCNKLRGGIKIVMNVDEVRRVLPVWHLNPTLRTDLPIPSKVAKETRIDYCLWRLKDGEQMLILKEIMHKNAVNKNPKK